MRPTFEGRPLARPDEPLADQGLRFDLATLVSRRRALAAGSSAAVLGLAACATGSDASDQEADGSADATSEGEIPEETNGPYPADGTNGANVLTESGVIRSDLTSSFGTGSAVADGVPITLSLTLTNLDDDNAPYEGVAVYVWQCDAEGRYSLYSEGLGDENYLRGVQVADADGVVTFTSIFPACYSGRWPHIHFEVYPDADSITSIDTILATSQVALPQDVCETVYALEEYDGSLENLDQVSLESDNVFGDDGGELQLADVGGDVLTGFEVSLPVAIDPTTAPGLADGGAGGMGGAPDGEGGPGGDGGEPPEGGAPPAGGPSDQGGAGSTVRESLLVGSALVSSR